MPWPSKPGMEWLGNAKGQVWQGDLSEAIINCFFLTHSLWAAASYIVGPENAKTIFIDPIVIPTGLHVTFQLIMCVLSTSTQKKYLRVTFSVILVQMNR